MSRRFDSSTLSATGERVDSDGGILHPYLFLVLQSHAPLAPPMRISLAGIDEIVFGRGSSTEVAIEDRARRARVKLADRWLSSEHARIGRVLGRFFLDDGPSKNGSFVNGVQQSRAELLDGDIIELGHCFFIFRDALPGAPQASPVFVPPASSALTTLVPALEAAFERLAVVAGHDISVILQGPTGSGKEVLARQIHTLSNRTGDFVAINCGALPRDLIEAELFGHKRGAFSGATDDRLGLFRSADKGTLLLDEVGDMPLNAQPALLRALQEREVRPVGGTRPVAVDVRVLAATHRDLDEMAASGGFRQDLLARLSGHRLEMPPLRTRKEDLGILIAAILRRCEGGGTDIRLQSAAARSLLSYNWPGNVRELEKCLTTAVVLAKKDGVIDVPHLPPPVQRATADASAARELEEAQRRERLVALLVEHNGNLSAVARALGKARVQVQRWVKRYRLDAEKYRR